MIRTILLGSAISAQGRLKVVLPDGRLEIDVDGTTMTGRDVRDTNQAARAA